MQSTISLNERFKMNDILGFQGFRRIYNIITIVVISIIPVDANRCLLISYI